VRSMQSASVVSSCISDDAKAFYRALGFEPSPNELMMPMVTLADIRKSIAQRRIGDRPIRRRTRSMRRTRLFAGLSFSKLSKSYTRATAVLVDELDAGGSQSMLNNLKRFRITGITTNFNIVDRISMKTCRFREFPDGQI
jgi:hypothetical protein